MTFAFLGTAVFLAFCIEAMTGFGSLVFALSLGALVLPLDQLAAMLIPLNLLLTIPMTWRHRASIHRPLLFKQILPWMVSGTIAGLFIAPHVPAGGLKLVFACLIIWFAGRALLQANPSPLPDWVRNLTIAAAGVTHGLVASGGPVLVYALARTGLDKTQFRATLIPVWATLNIGLTTWFLIQGRVQAQIDTTVWLVPCVFLGMWVGSKLHHRVDQAKFMRVVFGVLLLVGMVLLLGQLR